LASKLATWDLTVDGSKLARDVFDSVVGNRQEDEFTRREKGDLAVVDELDVVSDTAKGESEGRTRTARPDDGNVHSGSDPFQPLSGAVRY